MRKTKRIHFLLDKGEKGYYEVVSFFNWNDPQNTLERKESSGQIEEMEKVSAESLCMCENGEGDLAREFAHETWDNPGNEKTRQQRELEMFRTFHGQVHDKAKKCGADYILVSYSVDSSKEEVFKVSAHYMFLRVIKE